AAAPDLPRAADRRVPHGDHADHADAAGARRALPRPRGRLGRRAAGAAARLSRTQPRTTTASTSNAAPLGRADTSMVERAGYGAWKYSAMTALTWANWPRSVRYRPSLATSSNEPPAASHTALRLSKARRAWTAMSPSDRKSTRLNSSHVKSSYAVFCLKKKIIGILQHYQMRETDRRYNATKHYAESLTRQPTRYHN